MIVKAIEWRTFLCSGSGEKYGKITILCEIWFPAITTIPCQEPPWYFRHWMRSVMNLTWASRSGSTRISATFSCMIRRGLRRTVLLNRSILIIWNFRWLRNRLRFMHRAGRNRNESMTTFREIWSSPDGPPQAVSFRRRTVKLKISPTSYRVFPVRRTHGYRADFYFLSLSTADFCECFFSFCHLHTSPHKPPKIFVLINYNLLRSASLASS